jgi:hypothetical protein
MKSQHRQFCAVECYTTQVDWAEYWNIRCVAMIIMLNILLGTLDEICIFFHCIIVQNLGTERGDPSASSVCSISTQLVMYKASLTDPEPCHCDLLPPDGTLG